MKNLNICIDIDGTITDDYLNKLLLQSFAV